YFANTSYFVVKKENLFPRIDLKKELAELEAAEAAAKAEPAVAATPAVEASPAKVEKAAEPLPEGIISIEEFMNVRLLAAKVLDCEPVPKSDKLLRLVLDDGSGTPRQVVSGIHAWYEPADLIGKTVAVVSNLKPVKLRGVASNGMILAADAPKPDGSDCASVLFLADSVPAGARIR
ncbi:MAG: methionine--tRNA ligase subunit beta, partial [Oscillospiraceae bacterium]